METEIPITETAGKDNPNLENIPANPIEHMEKTPGPTMEKKAPTKKAAAKRPKRGSVERIGHCNCCGNEWRAFNGNEAKPSRCPACKSRDVSWRDELGGKKQHYEPDYAINSQDANKPLYSGYEDEEYEEEYYNEPDEEVMEKIKSGMPKIPMQTIVLILGGIAALGIIVFLRARGKAMREARLRQIQQQEEPQQQCPPQTLAGRAMQQCGLLGRS